MEYKICIQVGFMFLKHYNAICIKSSDLMSTIIEHFENTFYVI